jgi:hypothetical protein
MGLENIPANKLEQLYQAMLEDIETETKEKEQSAGQDRTAPDDPTQKGSSPFYSKKLKEGKKPKWRKKESAYKKQLSLQGLANQRSHTHVRPEKSRHTKKTCTIGQSTPQA